MTQVELVYELASFLLNWIDYIHKEIELKSQLDNANCDQKE